MGEQQPQRVNQAAEEFTNAMKDTYQTVASRGESVQQVNAEMMQQFFNSVINNLQSQTQANVQAGKELASQVLRRQEATRQLTQETVQGYMDYINSTFSFAQAAPDAAKRTTAERTEGTTTGAVAGTEGGPPGSAERVGPLGREDGLPREERGALGREDRLPREERGALGREDRLPREESARETEREEDKGLLDKALDKLSGRGDEEGRREAERRER
jgi:hypothetical protein